MSDGEAVEVSADELALAREWLDSECVGRLPADQRSAQWVTAAVALLYPGGWPAFLAVARQVCG